MKDYRRFASAGVLIGTQPNGRVKSTSFFRNLFGPIAYAMTASDLEKLKRGMTRLAQVYFAAGAEAVYPTSFVDLEMRENKFRTNRDIERFVHENVRKPDDLTLSSAHPQGGNPMSDNRRLGVVDSRFKVHGSDNLYVCDASVFPTSIGINPQLTIMAMADYAWHLQET
jgi:choline dehydrogenase-like flavoprotein